MYTIIVDYIYSRIEPKLSSDLATKINVDLRFRPTGYQYTWAFKHKKSDGYEYLFDIVNNSFRTGLLSRVLRRLDGEKVEYKVFDNRKRPERVELPLVLSNIDPFPYQIEAADVTEGISHGIIASPTGTGKSLMMMLIAHKHQMRTLIIVNSRTLLDQTYEAFDEAMPGKVGIVGSGDFELNYVVIATSQSLCSILGVGKKQSPSDKASILSDWLDRVGLIIVDEVHEADSSSITKFLSRVNAYKIIGTTATPYEWGFVTEKGKNLEVEQNCGVKVYDSRGKVDFIKIGINVPVVVNRIVAPKIDEFKYYNGEGVKQFYSGREMQEYRDVVTAQVEENEKRHQLITKIAESIVKSGLSTYIYYRHIKHGEQLMEEMSHLNPVMLQGKTARGQRNKVFREINEKKRLLVISDIGSYGLNIRSLDSIICAHPARDFRQLKGRVCRAYPNKEVGVVYDLIDQVPYLDKHNKLRLNQAKKDDDVICGVA